jgi:hypothetical protein
MLRVRLGSRCCAQSMPVTPDPEGIAMAAAVDVRLTDQGQHSLEPGGVCLPQSSGRGVVCLHYWDRERSPPGYPPPFANHEPLLWAAGFSVHACDVQSGAEERRRAIYEHALAEQDELI